jgi:hypothetical protein
VLPGDSTMRVSDVVPRAGCSIDRCHPTLMVTAWTRCPAECRGLHIPVRHLYDPRWAHGWAHRDVPLAAQIGSARAYLAGSSPRQRSGITGTHGTIASMPWIFMQTIVSQERAHMPQMVSSVRRKAVETTSRVSAVGPGSNERQSAGGRGRCWRHASTLTA